MEEKERKTRIAFDKALFGKKNARRIAEAEAQKQAARA